MASPVYLSKRDPLWHSYYKNLNPGQKKETELAFAKWKQNPRLVSFKPLRQGKTLYSAQVGPRGRALASVKGPVVLWLWVGFSHADYEKMIAALEARGY